MYQGIFVEEQGILGILIAAFRAASNRFVPAPRPNSHVAIIGDLARVHLRRSAKTRAYDRAWP